MKLSPAPPNSGVVFRLIKEGKTSYIQSQPMTMLNPQNYVLLFPIIMVTPFLTVEHILSALYGLEIDNIFIDLNSNEVPVCDGSSMMFVDLLKKNGFQSQNRSKNLLK